ncbi:MAG: zf-HC2 domain-containing protein [Candidatus Aminicenantales bacterium]
MKCSLAQEWINEFLDGELGPKREAKLKAHLEACPDCRALARDLEMIVRQAGNLGALEPSAGIWPRVAAAVRESREGAPASFPGKRSWPGAFWNKAAWRFAAAAALALVIVGTVIIRQEPRMAADSVREGSVEYSLVKLQEAQDYYEKAILSLNEAVQSQDSSLSPQLAEIFKRNLAAMDETIQACRQIVEEDPGNLTARAYLLTAYREQVNVLEEMMGLKQSSVRGRAETAL